MINSNNDLNPFEVVESTDEKPIHEHDCKRCVFLGNAYDPNHDDEEKFNSGCGDLYWCKGPGSVSLDTMIFRYGILGDYVSAHPPSRSEEAKYNNFFPWYKTIITRAAKAGLI